MIHLNTVDVQEEQEEHPATISSKPLWEVGWEFYGNHELLPHLVGNGDIRTQADFQHYTRQYPCN